MHNEFSSAFRAFLEQKPRIHTLTSLASAAGLTAGQLSHFASGKRPLTATALAKIARALEPRHAVPLAIAFCRDNLPPELRDFISITVRESSRIAEGTADAPTLTKFQQAVQTLRELENVPQVVRHIISTADTLLHLVNRARQQ